MVIQPMVYVGNLIFIMDFLFWSTKLHKWFWLAIK